MFRGYAQPSSTPSTSSSAAASSFPALYVDNDGEIVTEERSDEKRIIKNQKINLAIDQEARRIEKQKEAQTVYKIGAGDSDDEDEDECMPCRPISIDEADIIPSNLPKKPNPSWRLLEIQRKHGRNYVEDCKIEDDNRNLKEESEDGEIKDENSPRRSKKKNRKRRKSRSRSRSSSRSRNYRRKNRRRSPTPERRYSSPPVVKIKQNKWSFLDDREIIDMTNHSFFITQTNIDFETSSIGIHKREVPKYWINIKKIEGCSQEVFNDVYPELSSKNKKEKEEFYDKLTKIAKHPPQERQFRQKIPERTYKSETGYWELSKEPRDCLQYNRERIESEQEQIKIDNEYRRDDIVADETIIKGIADLEMKGRTINQLLERNKHNINLWIEFIQLQDKIFGMREIYKDSRRACLERKEAILAKAIEKNPGAFILKLMNIDNLIEMNKSTEIIINEYNKISHSFPHEPLIWKRYLDYVQYNGSVYTCRRLDAVFDECFKKLRGLTEGTLQSHIAKVKDWKEMRRFYLYVYIRHLRWLIDSGYVPKAIANIQATFELNFGFNESILRQMHSRRLVDIKQFWDSKMPRIGDSRAMGALLELERFSQEEGLQRKFEIEDYDIYSWEVDQAVKDCLERNDRPIAKNWAEFERKMLNLDARVKRNPIDSYEEINKENMVSLDLWPPIESHNLTVYRLPLEEEEGDRMYFIQALLETLGAKFVTSTESWRTTTQLLDIWKNDGILNFDGKMVFDEVPSHVEPYCRKLTINILQFLARKTFNKQIEVQDEMTCALVAATILTGAEEMAKQNKEPMWKMHKDLPDRFMKNMLEPIKSITDANPDLQSLAKLIAVQKLMDWHRLGKQNITEIDEENERRERNQKDVEEEVCKTERKRIMQTIPKRIFKILNECTPPLANGEKWEMKGKQMRDIQKHLFGVLLNCQIANSDDKRWIGCVIGTQLMGMTKEDKENHENRELIVSELLKIQNEVEEMEKDGNNMNTGTNVLPAASITLHAIYMILEFSHMEDGGDNQFMIGEITMNVKHKVLRMNIADQNVSRDAKLLIDVVLFYLTENTKRKISYFTAYKHLSGVAQCVFKKDLKYIKRFVEDNTTSMFKKIELQKSLETLKNQVVEVGKVRFDMEKEAERMIISIALMSSSLRMTSEIEESKNGKKKKREDCGISLKTCLKYYTKEATFAHDPTLWRLAIKLAGKIENGKKLLEETHILATGQCPWSRNIHIDRVDEEPTEDVLINMMTLMLEKGKGASSSHDMFVSDIGILKTYVESVNKRIMEVDE